MQRTKKIESPALPKVPIINPNHKGDVSAILCADIHIHENSPVCRLDNFNEETQWKKLDWLKALQVQYNCPVLHAGDLFDYWKPSPELISRTIAHLPKQFCTVYGNHDLPQHNVELAYKSGVFTLHMSEALHVLEGTHWGGVPAKPSLGMPYGMSSITKPVLVWHIMTYQGKEPYPGCTAPKGAKLLRQYPDYDLILTGDNHTPFVEECNGRLLVNPGSLFRTKADQINHKPRVYLWYAESNTVEAVYVPIESGVVSREHLESKETRSRRIDAFISTLNEDFQAEMSFEENLEKFKDQNNIKDVVMQIIYKSIE